MKKQATVKFWVELTPQQAEAMSKIAKEDHMLRKPFVEKILIKIIDKWKSR